MLFHRLLIDKQIISIEPLTISLDGIVFKGKGGYTEKSKLDDLENIRIKMIESDLKKSSYGLMIFTGVVAIGTIISAIYFALEIWRHFF